MIRSRFAATTALGAVTVLALSACSAGTATKSETQAPASAPASSRATSGAPASSAPASSAPASSAPASQGGGGSKPSTPATQLAITGNVAGLDFQPVDDAAKQQATGIQQMAKNAKIEPASCQKVLQMSQATDPKATGMSMAMNGQTGYVAGVAPSTVSLKEMKALYQACPKMTMEFQGQKIPMEIKVSDVSAPGATEALMMTQTLEVMGQKATNVAISGSARGLLVTAMGSGAAVEPAKVTEIFKAQAAKVASAT
ncbi:hypothetical protein [Mariniluteicoccus flavus]